MKKLMMTMAAAGKSPEVKVYGNSQTAANCFNALLWHYADSASDLQIEDGYLYYTNGSLLYEWFASPESDIAFE